MVISKVYNWNFISKNLTKTIIRGDEIMEQRNYLQIPGPTNVPDRILKALSKPLVNHRGEQFKEIMVKSIEGLKEIFMTDNDILIFPS